MSCGTCAPCRSARERARSQGYVGYTSHLCVEEQPLTLLELEQLAARLNAESEEHPLVYLDDRSDIVDAAGALAWVETLARRCEDACWLREVMARGGRRIT